MHQVMPPEVIPPEVIPPEVMPPEVIPPDILDYPETSQNTSTPSAVLKIIENQISFSHVKPFIESNRPQLATTCVSK